MRHAQSLGNLQGLMEGQGSTELSAKGWHQAQRLSQRLIPAMQPAELLAEPLAKVPAELPTHLYSSPLLRASQTTEVLSRALQAVNHTFSSQSVYALQEMHQGIFQGLTWAQAQAQYPEVCGKLLSTLAWQSVPQAETLQAARDRAQRWVNHILQVHQPGEIIWAISHEGILQQIVAVMLGCDRTWKIAIAHTAIFEFWLAETLPHPPPIQLHAPHHTQWQHLTHNRFNPEYWHIRRFNDSSHLANRPVR